MSVSTSVLSPVCPETDLYESEAGFFVQVALPGVPPQQLEVTLERDVLRVAGTVPADPACSKHFPEVRYQRALRVPQVVDRQKIEVTLQHGLLTLSLPKTAKPARIRIPVNLA